MHQTDQVIATSGKTPPVLDRIFFRGHPNILGNHRNTIEVLKDEEISKRADCVIGVGASKGCSELNKNLRDWIQRGGKVELEIKVDSFSFVFAGQGHPELKLEDPRELVLRRSSYISPRTMAVNCSSAACDVPRSMIRRLQDPRTKGLLNIKPVPGDSVDNFLWTLP